MKNDNFVTPALLLLLAVTFSMASCGEEDEITIIGEWKITEATFNPPIDTNGAASGGEITDAYSILFSQPCNQDDYFVFENGGIFKEEEGATKCDPADPQTVTGTYTYSGSTLTIFTPSDTTVLNNTVVTKSQLTCTATFNFGGPSATVDFIMTRQ